MPDAFSMNSTLEVCKAAFVPAAISAACSVLKRSTYALYEATSSALVMESDGVQRPVAEMATVTA
jgi:hypothetical protein